VALGAGVRAGAEFGLERALLGLARHLDAGALTVEFPPVVDAANALGLVAPEEEGRAAMGTVVLDEPDPAGRQTERDQVLAEEPHAHRRAVGLRQLGGDQRGNPELADQVPPPPSAPAATHHLLPFPPDPD